MIFFISLGLSLFSCLHAKRPPVWVNGYWKDLDNSYIGVFFGDGRNAEDARNKAMDNIRCHRSLVTGQRSKVSTQNNKTDIQGNDELTISTRIIDTHIENVGSSCRVYLLAQVLRNPSYSYESVYVTDKYPFSARVFVPGMAQIHKGQTGKGVGFILGEISFISGIVASEFLRQSYDAKVLSTHSNILRKEYADNANICMLSRNIAIAGAAALYVWNIIDGSVAKGKKHIVVGDAQLLLAPYVTSETGGLALSVKF